MVRVATATSLASLVTGCALAAVTLTLTLSLTRSESLTSTFDHSSPVTSPSNLWLFAEAVDAAAESAAPQKEESLPNDKDSKDCILTSKHCENFPKLSNSQFLDNYGMALLGLGNPSSCLRRAEDFHHWCGNGRENEKASVSATYRSTGDTQVYHPTACDPEWSLYGAHCYIHVWRAKTWWEAENWCAERGANLCSIHGKAENEFVFTLTKGLSSWIGYHDQDQDEVHEWSDNTKTDFENMSKDCTGREDDPDCKPEEKAQQWYDWNGADRGTWVCKKKAKYGLKLLRNSTASLEALPTMDWEELKLPVEAIPTLPKSLEEEEEDVPVKPVRKQAVGLGPAKEKCMQGKC